MEAAVRASAHENSSPRAELDVGRTYEKSLPRLKRIAAGMGLTLHDAEDALHDSYVALLQNRRKLDDAQHADRWLTRVMVNRCLLFHRRRKRPHPPADPPGAAQDSPISHDEQRRAVHEALHELAADSLAALVLRYFCDLNSAQIAEILEIPAATVRSRIRLARVQMAERLLAKGVVNDAD
jgi:RNA polymerase sigma-70 factor (ECF subfamily)